MKYDEMSSVQKVAALEQALIASHVALLSCKQSLAESLNIPVSVINHGLSKAAAEALQHATQATATEFSREFIDGFQGEEP